MLSSPRVPFPQFHTDSKCFLCGFALCRTRAEGWMRLMIFCFMSPALAEADVTVIVWVWRQKILDHEEPNWVGASTLPKPRAVRWFFFRCMSLQLWSHLNQTGVSHIWTKMTKVTYYFNLETLDHLMNTPLTRNSACSSEEPHVAEFEHMHLQNSQANAWRSFKVCFDW